MSRPVAAGLAEYLGEELGRRVEISILGEASAGARRRNVLFDAVDGSTRLELVASITPSAAILLMPTETEASTLRVVLIRKKSSGGSAAATASASRKWAPACTESPWVRRR